MTARFALTVSEADVPSLFPAIHTQDCNRALCKTRGSNYVSPTSKSV